MRRAPLLALCLAHAFLAACGIGTIQSDVDSKKSEKSNSESNPTPPSGNPDHQDPTTPATEPSTESSPPIDGGARIDTPDGSSSKEDAATPIVDAAPDSGQPPRTGTDPNPFNCSSKTTDEQKIPYCLARSGSVQLKIFRPKTSTPMQMSVYLHGDAAGWDDDWGLENFARWSLDRNILFVAPLSPNECSWIRKSCDNEEFDTGPNATALSNALSEIKARYAIDTSKPILYTGFLGGSYLLTSQFVPMFGGIHPGPVVLNCGAYKPTTRVAWDYASKSYLVPLYFQFGSAGRVAQDVNDTIRAYRDLRWSVAEPYVMGNFNDCNQKVDWDQYTTGIWQLFVK